MKTTNYAGLAGDGVPISQLEAKSAFLDYVRQTLGHAPEVIREEGVIQRFSTNGKRGDLSGCASGTAKPAPSETGEPEKAVAGIAGNTEN